MRRRAGSAAPRCRRSVALLPAGRSETPAAVCPACDAAAAATAEHVSRGRRTSSDGGLWRSSVPACASHDPRRRTWYRGPGTGSSRPQVRRTSPAIT